MIVRYVVVAAVFFELVWCGDFGLLHGYLVAVAAMMVGDAGNYIIRSQKKHKSASAPSTYHAINL